MKIGSSCFNESLKDIFETYDLLCAASQWKAASAIKLTKEDLR